MTTIAQKLLQAGIALPQPSAPAASYANYVRHNGLLFLSGKGPAGGAHGKLGAEFSTEEGYRLARAAAIELLAVLQEATGNLERVTRIVKIQGFVNAVPSYTEHHKALNGCSDLMLEIFGERGIHARSVFGANSLRDGLPVIVECIAQIDFDSEQRGGTTREDGHYYV